MSTPPAIRCDYCGDVLHKPDPARPYAVTASTKYPTVCVGCACDIEDPNTTPGGYSS